MHDRQIGHTRVKLGEVRVVLTAFVAFYSDFLESDETPIICFDVKLAQLSASVKLAYFLAV